MSDDAPAPAGGAPAAGGGGGGHGAAGGSHATDQTNGAHDKIQPKPRITKSTFNTNVSDLVGTPRRVSADSLDLDDYFVRAIHCTSVNYSNSNVCQLGRPS